MALLKFKRSATPGKAPTIADIALGELAMNTYDGKLYMKKDDGTEAIVDITAGGGGGGSGTVTSVAASGGTTGFSFTGSPITTSGTLTLTGTLNVANGGTGATSLTSGYLVKGNGTSAVTASVVYDNGTNVGIGTTSPNARLSVAGRADFGISTDALVYLTNAANAVRGVLDVGTSDFTIGASGGGVPLILLTSGSERMRIDSSGNVGIGTSSPAQRLHVESTSGAAGSAVARLAVSGTAALEAGQEFFSTPTDSTTSLRSGRIYSKFDGISYTDARLSFQSMTSGNTLVDTMHLKGGNVGIGTSSPSQKLTVSGTIESTTGGFKFPDGTTQTTAATGGGSGTVTSVAATVPTGFTISGSPITTSGTLAIGFASGYALPTTASQTNWDSVYTTWGGKTAPSGTVVGTSDTQTLTNKTITNLVFDGDYTEEVFTITDGASVDLDPSNGTIQLWTLGASRSPTATGFAAGQSMTLMVNDGTAYAITWPSVTWVGGSAPTLATSGYTVVELWKVGSTLYGAHVGNVA